MTPQLNTQHDHNTQQEGSTRMNTNPKMKITMDNIDLITFYDNGGIISGTPMSTWAQPMDDDPTTWTRILYVGDLDVLDHPDRVFTLPEAQRLHEIPLPRLEVFGRVDLGRDDDYVLGCDVADDTLAVARYGHYRKDADWRVTLKIDGPVTPDQYEGLALEVNDTLAMANVNHEMYLEARNSPLITLPEVDA